MAFPSLNEPRRRTALALCCLLLLPLCLLWPSVLGGKVFLPFDHAVWPPASLRLSAQEITARNANANFDITEKGLLVLPELELARQELSRGRLPSWDPYVRCGAPLYANGLAGLANPCHLPHLLLPPAHAFAFTAWLAMALAGMLMLGFLRSIGVGLLAALFGGIAFQLSGTMAANWHFYMRYEVLAWMPGMFWALRRLQMGSGAGAACGLALCTAMVWTAGFPPFALVVSVLAGIYSVAAMASGGSGRELGRRALWVATGFGVGVALAAVQLWPMFDYFPQSQRDLAPDLSRLPEQGMDPAAWLGLVLHAPFSTPLLNHPGGVSYDRPPLYWLLFSRAGQATEPLFNSVELALYPGAAVLCLLPLGLRWRAGSRFAWFAVGASVALLWLATGGVPTGWLYALVPPLRSTPPMRLAGPVAFCLAAAGALGLDGLLQRPRAARCAAVAALGLAGTAVLAACALSFVAAGDPLASLLAGLEQRWGERFAQAGADSVRAYFAPAVEPAIDLLDRNLVHAAVAFGVVGICLWARQRAASAAVLVVFTAIELVLLASPLNPSHPPAPPDTPVHRFLRARRDARQLQGGFMVARVAATAPDAPPSPALPTALPPNTLVPARIRDLNAYAFVDGKSHLPFLGDPGAELPIAGLYGPEQRIRQFWFHAFPDDARLQRPLFDLLGVRYMLCHVPAGHREPVHAGNEVLRMRGGEQGDFVVFERQRALPRAWVVGEATVLPDERAVIARLQAADFEPARELLVTASDWQAFTGKPSAPAAAANPRVEVVHDEASHVQVAVGGSDGGLLVLADTFMSGWSAAVDEKPVPILRGDLFLRAVPIPAGDCVVRFRYTAPGLWPGATVALLAAAMWLGLWWRGRNPRA